MFQNFEGIVHGLHMRSNSLWVDSGRSGFKRSSLHGKPSQRKLLQPKLSKNSPVLSRILGPLWLDLSLAVALSSTRLNQSCLQRYDELAPCVSSSLA